MSRLYPDRPIIGIGVVVLSGERVLLIRRGREPRKGQWSLPGGAQELGESHHEAAMREVAEETGLTVRIQGLIDVIDLIDPDSEGAIRQHYTLVDLWATPISGTLRPGDDADDARWFTEDELDTLELWSETRRIIDRALGQSRALSRQAL